jgi:FkbM family methyltransferase
MNNSSQRIKELLLASNLYGLVHRVHSATIGRDAGRARAKMIQFFKHLLPENSLVFDIGANVGAVSHALACAGARVVALEPNPDCARNMQLMYRNENIQVIQAAVGAHNTLANLNVSDHWDCTCTLSSEWMKTMQATDERYKNNWLRQMPVPVLTLDELISHFGSPYFIKIDVEGYEVEVLRGLSRQPAFLSFEFHKTYLEAGFQALDSAVFANDSRFNMVLNAEWGFPAQFHLERWMTKDEMFRELSNLAGADDQGDIYVRHPSVF